LPRGSVFRVSGLRHFVIHFGGGFPHGLPLPPGRPRFILKFLRFRVWQARLAPLVLGRITSGSWNTMNLTPSGTKTRRICRNRCVNG
jgi:hypothetical protein